MSIKLINGKRYIFEIIRKKYVIFTPEEFVRQNFVLFLIKEKNYPAGLIATEKLLKINKLSKRVDIILFTKTGKAAVIVECKSPKIKITQKAFDQILRYNINFKAKFLIVTNGTNDYCLKHDFKNNKFIFLNYIPDYNEILKNYY